MDSAAMMPALFAWFLAFVFSTTVHEAAHAWAAKLLGDDTAYLGGQVSLNPLPHMQREPWGMVLIPLISFFLMQGQWMIGWASAPYDPRWARRYPQRSALMALAGPVSNLVLALVSGLILRIGIGAGALTFNGTRNGFAELFVATSAGAADSVAMIASVFFVLNVVLFLFNLMPVPPLDGSAVVQLAMPGDWARRYQDLFLNPMWSLVGIVAAWQLFPKVFYPVFNLFLLLPMG